MSTACYLRTSTEDQSHASQEAEIRKWLAGNSIDESKVQWYVDTDSSETLNRVEFRRLQRAIFTGQVKTVIVWKLDRISRRKRDGERVIADWCDKGVRVIVVTLSLDISGVIGQVVASILLGLAELELESIRQRQRAGIEIAKREGKYRGRRPGSLKGSPKRAVQLHQQGLTYQEIATALGISTRSVIRYCQAARDMHLAEGTDRPAG